jgi:branched-chain amino acid transport system ATP-binding protein
MLEIRNLTGGWGSTTVVQDLSMNVQSGETVSIIGRNGVGKTTLLELIVGRANQLSGDVFIDGKSLLTEPSHVRSQIGLGFVPQQREVFPSLTVEENLAVARRSGQWTEATLFELFPGLGRRRNSPGRALSGGEQQMLAIARALIGNPRVLLMDEPSEGLAPIVVEQLVEAIRALVANHALAVLLVEQRVDIAIDLSTRCLVMDRGRIVRECVSADLRKEPNRIGELMGLTHQL